MSLSDAPVGISPTKVTLWMVVGTVVIKSSAASTSSKEVPEVGWCEVTAIRSVVAPLLKLKADGVKRSSRASRRGRNRRGARWSRREEASRKRSMVAILRSEYEQFRAGLGGHSTRWTRIEPAFVACIGPLISSSFNQVKFFSPIFPDC